MYTAEYLHFFVFNNSDGLINKPAESMPDCLIKVLLLFMKQTILL